MESFFIITVLLSIVCPSLSEEYYVVAEGGDSCPNDSPAVICRDLSHYVNQSEVYFTSNTTLTFLQGTHVLDQDGPVIITDVTNLTLQGMGVVDNGIDWTVNQSTVIISCGNRRSGLLLRNFDNVVLLGLTIFNCGFRLTPSLKHSIAKDFYVTQYNFDYAISFGGSFSILLLNGVHAVIEDFSIQNGTGYGLATANVYDMEILSSTFSGNNFNCMFNNNDCSLSVGGNIRLAYIDSTVCPRESGNVSMRNVSLSFGTNCGCNPVVYDPKQFDVCPTGGGLAVLTTSSKCGEVVFDFQYLDTFSNQAELGSNIWVKGLPMTIRFNRLTCSNGIGNVGGNGIAVLVTQSPSSESSATELVISNSEFIDNRNGGVAAGFYLQVYASKFYDQVTLESCLFSKNSALSILTVFKNNDVTKQPLKLNLLDVHMYDNGVRSSQDDINFVGAIVLVNCECFARGLEVVNTRYTGIEMLSSTITFTGNNLIQNNTYTNGGGMVLLRHSRVLFRPPTVVSFIDNSAEGYGGAIYIPQDTVYNYIGACFYQIDDLTQSTAPGVVIRAINNSAGITGEFLSGGNLGACYIVGTSRVSFVVNEMLVSYTYLLGLIQPEVDPSDYYFISSVPVGVVLCYNGSFSINNDRFVRLPFEFYQGRPFDVDIAAVSETQGLAPGSITINVCNCTDRKTCSDCSFTGNNIIDTFTRTTEAMCSNISITLTGNMYTQSLAILLSTNNTVFYQSFLPLILLLNSSTCPPGFSKYDICNCDQAISDIASCDIQTDTLTTNGTVWISYDNTSKCVLYSDKCPEDFCRSGNSTFNIIDSPDLQCASYRSGILCGQCAQGYSLFLGSNECGLCPNDNYLSLLLVFSVAGVALVVLLIVLNLTVSVGTINGLVFYANIVKINEDVLFPNNSSDPLILRQFISFINLDLGLPACFYNGMTPYVKAWLQFVFPLYIWFIMIVIMLLSRQFTKISKLIGNNAVKVFATLLLLSYTKIIRAIGVALSYETVSCSDGEELEVWRYDGNMNYGSTEHVILVVFALLFLLFLVLPYSLLLISIPFIARLFALIRCRFLWIKPFIDAYAGPFQRTHQFWPGMLIIARIVLTIVKNVIQDDIPSLYLAIFCVIFFLAIAVDLHGPYEKNYLNVLESWFLVNLLGLCVLGLRESTVRVGSIVSVSLIFVTFVGIIILHLFWFCRDHFSGRFNNCRKHTEEGEESVVPVNNNNKELVMTASSDLNKSTNLLINSQRSGNSGGSSSAVSTSVVKVSRRKATFSRYRDSILNSFDSRA